MWKPARLAVCREPGWRPGSRSTASIASGCSNPAATPCTIRAATTKPKLVDSAPATLPVASTATPARNTRRKPKRSSSHGDGSIATVIAAMNPVIVHCTWFWPRPKCRLSAGTATLKLVVHSTAAIMPTPTTSSTSHL